MKVRNTKLLTTRHNFITQSSDVISRFNEIYDATSRKVLIFVTAKCKSTADISDIVQDTYMELFLIMSKYGHMYVKNEHAYVMSIAKRKLSQHYSLIERLRFIVSTTATNDEGECIELTELEADSFLLEDFVVNQVMIETAKAFIKKKPEEVKKVFYLHYYMGLPIPEIAQILSLNESSVKNKLYRTLKELRNLLK